MIIEQCTNTSYLIIWFNKQALFQIKFCLANFDFSKGYRFLKNVAVQFL